MIKKISQKNFNETMNSRVAVIDFSAAWCGPCNMLKPILEEVSEELDGKVDFYNIDVDHNQDIAMKYSIQSIPTLIVFKDGRKVEQQVGFQTKEGIYNLVKSHL